MGKRPSWLVRKTNSSPHCAIPKDCRAQGDKLCRRCAFLKVQRDPKTRAATSAAMKARFQNPEYRERHREWVRENARKLNADYKNKKAARKRGRKLGTDPELRARMKATVRKQLEDPAFLEQKRIQAKENLNSPKATEERKRTMLRNGRWLRESQKDEIARRVAFTKETLASIGRDYHITRTHTAVIARERGVEWYTPKRGGRYPLRVVTKTGRGLPVVAVSARDSVKAHSDTSSVVDKVARAA